jgi:hypothetical protein
VSGVGPALGLLECEPGFSGAGAAAEEELVVFLEGVEDFEAQAGVALEDLRAEIEHVAPGGLGRSGGEEGLEEPAGFVGGALEPTVAEAVGPPSGEVCEVVRGDDHVAGVGLVRGLGRIDLDMGKGEGAVDEGKEAAQGVVGESPRLLEDAGFFGLELGEGVLAIGGAPAAGGWIEFTGAGLGFEDEKVAVGALDDEVAFARGAAFIGVVESPADAELGAEPFEKRGGVALALRAGLGWRGENPAGHCQEKFEIFNGEWEE